MYGALNSESSATNISFLFKPCYPNIIIVTTSSGNEAKWLAEWGGVGYDAWSWRWIMGRASLLLVVWLAGMGQPVVAREKVESRGVVFLIGGAGGIENLHGFTRWAMRQAGCPHELRHFSWAHGKGRVVRDIQDTRHLLKKADELTQEILHYQVQFPDRPIYLIGKSTGCLIALMAAEKLPVASVEKIILLSPAVSPSYDLTAALGATRTEIYSYHSRLDFVVLDWGTSIFGTADRYYTKCAGLSGFDQPAPRSPASYFYERLKQKEWSMSHVWYGHLGGHLGNGMPLFLLFEVVPRLQSGSRIVQPSP